MIMKPVAPIAVTMGDANGIGGEILIKAWDQRAVSKLPPFFIICDLGWIKSKIEQHTNNVSFKIISSPEEAASCFHEAIPVLPLISSDISTDQASAKATLQSIEMAVEFCLNGEASAVVTNPIQKKRLYNGKSVV